MKEGYTLGFFSGFAPCVPPTFLSSKLFFFLFFPYRSLVIYNFRRAHYNECPTTVKVKMPFTPNLITRPYSILPVPSNFIPSSPLSPPSSPTPNSQQFRQRIFWVGCSDSSITETDCLAVDREEIFVHRNLGNILSNGDLSSESAVEWALDVSKVCLS
jgi:hypothetical protein